MENGFYKTLLVNFQLLITGTMPLNHKPMWKTGQAFLFSTPQEMFGDFWARMWLWWVQWFGCRSKGKQQCPTLLCPYFPLLPWRLGAFQSSRCLLRPPLCQPCPSCLPSSTESWGWATHTWQSMESRRCLTASCLSMSSRKKCSRFITAGEVKNMDDGCMRKWNGHHWIEASTAQDASLIKTLTFYYNIWLQFGCSFTKKTLMGIFSQMFLFLCLVSSNVNHFMLIKFL